MRDDAEGAEVAAAAHDGQIRRNGAVRPERRDICPSTHPPCQRKPFLRKHEQRIRCGQCTCFHAVSGEKRMLTLATQANVNADQQTGVCLTGRMHE